MCNFYDKLKMREKGTLVIFSLLLFFIAFLIRDWFLSFSIAEITGENIVFEDSWKLPYQVLPTFLFILSFGIIPFLFLFVKRICNLFTVKKQIISTTIIVATGIVFYILRVIFLKYKCAQINDLLRRAEFATEADIPRMRFEEMHLEIYWILGLFIGSLLSVITYKKKSLKISK